MNSMPSPPYAVSAMFRLLAFCLAIPMGAVGLSSTAAFAQEQAAQQSPEAVQASSEQIDKLIATWSQYFADTDTPLERRSAFERLMASTPQPTRVQIKHVSADGVPGDLMWPARVHYSPGHRAILYVHGGGIYGGSLRTHKNVAAALAKSATADVLLIDYRRMPEYLYPAQIDDVLRAYRWLLSSGYRNENIAIAGESVGANFAIEAVLRQMQVNGRLPAAVLALSPVADIEMKGLASADAAKPEVAMLKQQLGFDPATYLKGKSPSDPMASPVYANLSGFPPLLLQVGSMDSLHDDVIRLGQKAEKDGVEVKVETWPGMIHQWQIFPFWVQDARRAIDAATAFANDHFEDK